MRFLKFCLFLLLGFLVLQTLNVDKNFPGVESNLESKKMNPVGYFEIPVKDMNRAVKFYEAVFGYKFTLEKIDGNDMALFPFDEKSNGITGALAKGKVYKPTKNGTILYFQVENIEEILAKANAIGGKTLYPKTSIGENGFVAEFQDSEGNRIALNSK